MSQNSNVSVSVTMIFALVSRYAYALAIPSPLPSVGVSGSGVTFTASFATATELLFPPLTGPTSATCRFRLARLEMIPGIVTYGGIELIRPRQCDGENSSRVHLPVQ